MKLQQKVNELKTTVEDLHDEKRSLSLRVKELEADMEKLKTVQEVEKEAETLRAKLLAAETLCEELMDENEDMKRELRDLEEEMDEMQDNFRLSLVFLVYNFDIHSVIFLFHFAGMNFLHIFFAESCKK